jgi:hypothetical protein
MSLPLLCLLGAAVAADASGEQDLAFFESRIRPILIERCYKCHNSIDRAEGGLALDHRAALLRGGDRGPTFLPGRAEASLLMRAIRHDGDLRMPEDGAKLSESIIRDFGRWIDNGAIDPREQLPSAEAITGDIAWDAVYQQRKNWWCFQTPKPPAIPDAQSNWSHDRVDRFIEAKLQEAGLKPAAKASRQTLIRRLSYVLTGLPPTPEETLAFLADDSVDAYARLVDRLLQSSAFGERWARHWMDLVRYTESHGSESDPDLPAAWRYRDYLIRAINQDVPYDQILREHIAGDLLPSPRIDATLRTNESMIGMSHWRMVEHGYQPVDPWIDRLKWADNQIDVFAKAFQGLTISCARCHNHKYDAISQKDYYGLFSVFKGARPTQRAIDHDDYLAVHHEQLASLKNRFRTQIADVWLDQASTFVERLHRDETLAALIDQAAADRHNPLYAWSILHKQNGEAFSNTWRQLVNGVQRQVDDNELDTDEFGVVWDLCIGDYETWLGHGSGLPTSPSKAGEFSIRAEGDQILGGVYPPGVYSHLLSAKHNAVLQSPRFRIDSDYISVQMLGGNYGLAQLIVENYAVPRGGIYELRTCLDDDRMQWTQWKTKFWKGFTAYVEFATAEDVTHFQLDPKSRKRAETHPYNRDGRSWFGASKVAFHDHPVSPTDRAAPIFELLKGVAPDSPAALATHYRQTLERAIAAWRAGALDVDQAALLDWMVRAGALLNSRQELETLLAEGTPIAADRLAALASTIDTYRSLESEIPIARRAPGVLDEAGEPQPLLIRGDPGKLGEPVSPRLLSVLGGRPYPDPATARLRLAEEITNARNPLTARVAVNRIWYHLFGNGIVRTLDNFGRLGEAPDHPELLDYLAVQFVEDRWSIKRLIRRLVTTQTFQMSSGASGNAQEVDPDNRLLSYMPTRRLEAEGIRDAMLAISGRLDRILHGQSVPVYYDHKKGKADGDRIKGPIDGEGRRSIYQQIRRNAQHPFLAVFDLPRPYTTRGRRDVTNVPAQALTMMNSPLVSDLARHWGQALVATQLPTGERIDLMFLASLARHPTQAERSRASQLLAELAVHYEVPFEEATDSEIIWRDFGHALWNLKEFVYIP